MITIHFSKDGEAVTDFNYKEYIEKIKNANASYHPQLNYTLSTSLGILCIQKMVVDGDVCCDDIQFEYDGKIITIDKYGDFGDLPDGFGSIYSSLYIDMMQRSIKMKIEDGA